MLDFLSLSSTFLLLAVPCKFNKPLCASVSPSKCANRLDRGLLQGRDELMRVQLLQMDPAPQICSGQVQDHLPHVLPCTQAVCSRQPLLRMAFGSVPFTEKRKREALKTKRCLSIYGVTRTNRLFSRACFPSVSGENNSVFSWPESLFGFFRKNGMEQTFWPTH